MSKAAPGTRIERSTSRTRSLPLFLMSLTAMIPSASEGQAKVGKALADGTILVRLASSRGVSFLKFVVTVKTSDGLSICRSPRCPVTARATPSARVGA